MTFTRFLRLDIDGFSRKVGAVFENFEYQMLAQPRISKAQTCTRRDELLVRRVQNILPKFLSSEDAYCSFSMNVAAKVPFPSAMLTRRCRRQQV